MTSESPGLPGVASRLEKLERQNRRLKLAGVMILVLAGAGLLMGQARAKPRFIYAEGFFLRDSTGRQRAELSMLGDAVVLSLSPKDQKNGITLRLSPDGYGPGITMDDKDGNTRIALHLLSGSPHLSMTGENGKSSATLFVVGGAQSGLSLDDRRGNMRVLLGLDMGLDDSPFLDLYDERKNPRASLRLYEYDSPNLTLLDTNGKSRAVLGSTTLHVKRTDTVEVLPESSVVLFDKDGKVMWLAP